MSFEERKEYVNNNEIKWAKIVIKDWNTDNDNLIYFCDEKHKTEALEALEKEIDNERYDFIVATKKHQESYLLTRKTEQEMFYGKYEQITDAYKNELLNYIRWFDGCITVNITYFSKNGSKTFSL